MRELNYTPKALNTLTRFHRTKHVIYVEGDDDKVFWDEIFELYGLTDFHFKVAGGKVEIERLAETIVNDETDIIVARDCDYSDILNQQHTHKRILYTYGYSIENSMYCASSLAKAIRIYSRSTQEDRTSEIERWLESFSSTFEELIVYDIANDIFRKGIKVMGDKCVRFLKSDNSHIADEEEIKSHIKEIKRHFSRKEIGETRHLLAQSKKPLFFIIRGHFLTNAIMNFIKNKTKLKSMSHDMLFGQMVTSLFCCSNKDDMQYLKKQIDRLMS